MNLLAQFIPVFAIAGIIIAIVSNVILVFGRRPEFDVKDVLTSRHLKKAERERMFSETSLRIAVPLAYLGTGLFLFAVLLVVVGTILQYY